MAFTAPTVWDIRASAADDAGGGGFDPGNGNMATDLAATSATTSSPVATSASYNFAAGDVGHWLYVKSGTNWTAGWYQIASVAANAATLTAGIGTAVLATLAGTNTAAGCATVGSPTNGTWSIDYSQTDAAGIAFTDLVIDAVTNTDFTSAANPVGKNFVGNVINITSGTGFTVQRVQVVSTSGTTGTADKSLGTLSSTGGVGNLGGSLLSPGIAGSLWVIGNRAYIEAGTYTMSSSNNVAGGKMTITPDGTAVTPNILEGYTTIRTDGRVSYLASKPSFQSSTASSIYLLTLAGNHCHILNVDFQRTGGSTSIKGVSADGTNCVVKNCSSADCGTGFTSNGSSASFIRCYGNGRNPFICNARTNFDSCVADDATAVGFNVSANSTLVKCIALNSSDTVGFQNTGATYVSYRNCVAYGATGSGGHGFDLASSTAGNAVLIDCIAYSNSQTGYLYGTANGYHDKLVNCAAGANGTDFSTNIAAYAIENKITLTADPFTNAAGDDFSLNNTAGGGVLLRQLGFPTSFPGLSTNSYSDVGAAETVAGGGASGGGAIFDSPIIKAAR